jgi:hypothetical protein
MLPPKRSGEGLRRTLFLRQIDTVLNDTEARSSSSLVKQGYTLVSIDR